MECYTFLALLTNACVVLFHTAVSSSVLTRSFTVNGYNSYLDVSPVKYIVSPGTSQVTFHFQTFIQGLDCPAKPITILVKYGGLPLVNETNLSFPAKFLADQQIFMIQLFSPPYDTLVISWPKAGPWFVISYREREEKAIRQKGLNDEDICYYLLSTSVLPVATIISTVIDYKDMHVVPIQNEKIILRFEVPISTMSFKIQVIKCDPSPCNISLTYLSYDPSSSYKNTTMCNESASDCMLHVISPPLSSLQLLEIYNGLVNQTQTVTITISTRGCTDEHGNICKSTLELERVEFQSPFSTKFRLPFHSLETFRVDLDLNSFIVIPFQILDPNDIGGTLSWTMVAIYNIYESEIIVEVCGALLHNYLPEVTEDFDLCTNLSYGTVKKNFTTGTSNIQPNLYVPYPSFGIWHIMLQSTCFDNTSSKIRCPVISSLFMSLNIKSCLDNACSDKGTCTRSSVNSDIVVFQACKCDANYRGYACTDNTNAESISEQLTEAYLLTMSNLFFVPAIVISVRRRYFVEALVYLYNMFFSTFYHACDGTRLEKYVLCITRYDVLQIADFYGSTCSLWVTLITMARIRYRYVAPVLQMMGPLLLIIGVVYDKTSLYVIAIPIGFGVFIIAVSWGSKMFIRKKLYPSWRRYLFFLLPGIALAVIGASVFSFLETEDNYKYVHSVWHMCIALCICFLIPPRILDETDKNLDESNMTAQLLDHDTAHSSEASLEQINIAYVNNEGT